MNRCLHVLRRWPIAIAVTALLGIGAAPAGASSEIEQVWSFNGGEVAIHSVAGGKLTGVVVTPTTFDECAHQAGEEMWTNITPQGDGSFWGFHQWLFEKSCAANPAPGPTAWRVMQKANGARFLLVCFSEPGGPQPTIAPNGVVTGTARPCQESAPTAALPVVSGSNAPNQSAGAEQISFNTTILLPGAAACVKRGTLKIKVADPAHDPLKEVIVTAKRRKIADVSGAQKLKGGSILLRGLPNGTYTLKIKAITVLDQTLTGKRRYHACGRHHGKLKLRRRKGRHRH